MSSESRPDRPFLPSRRQRGEGRRSRPRQLALLLTALVALVAVAVPVAVAVVGSLTVADQTVDAVTATPAHTTLTADGATGPITWTFSPPANGEATIDGDELTYTSDAGFAGVDEVEVTATQAAAEEGGEPETGTGTVTVEVAPKVTIDAGPEADATIRDTTPAFEFSSTAADVDFECAFDDAPAVPCDSPATPAPLDDGEHTFSVIAVWDDGTTRIKSEPATRTFSVVAPIDPTEITSFATSGAPQTVTLSAAHTDGDVTWSVETGPDHGEASLDGDELTYTSEAGYAGPDQVVVKATDDSDEATATVDLTVRPDVTITDGPDGATDDTTPAFAFESSVDGVTFTCSIDGDAAVPCDDGTFTPATDLADGEHQLVVSATAGVGGQDYTGVEVRTFTVDLPPVVTITAKPDATDGHAVGDFAFEADKASDFLCKVDDGEFAACGEGESGTFSTAALDDGPHTFAVKATNGSGFTGAETSYGWTITNTPPVAADGTATVESGDDVDIDLDATDADDDALSYSITDEPDHGTLSGDGEDRTYTADEDYAGADAFTFQADDARPAGTDTGDVAVTVTPQTAVDGPSGLINDADSTWTFSSPVDGVTFECRLDSTDDADWAACDPAGYSVSLGDGDHTFQVRAVLDNGTDPALVDPTPATREITVDTDLPQTTIDESPTALSNAASPEFKFSADEASTFRCSVDGGEFTTCTSPHTVTGLTDGDHTFAVVATDTAGNEDDTAATFSWERDTAGPTITITSGPEGPTAIKSPTWQFTSNDVKPATTTTPTAARPVTCQVDAFAQVTGCLSPYTRTPGLSDGAHTLKLTSTDLAGNTTTITRAITVDTLAPDTAITEKPASIANGTAKFKFSTDEAGATYQCRIDGGSWDTCASPLDLTDLDEGLTKLDVRARDAAGNTDPSPASYEWRVITTLATATIASGPTGSTTDTDATFGIASTDPFATFQCSVDGAAFATCGSPLKLTGLALGERVLRVRALNRVGSVGPVAERRWTVVAPPAPPAPPAAAAQTPAATTPAATTQSSTSTGNANSTAKGCTPLSTKVLRGSYGALPRGLRARVSLTPGTFRIGERVAIAVEVNRAKGGKKASPSSALKRVEILSGTTVLTTMRGPRWAGTLATDKLKAGRQKLKVRFVRRDGKSVTRTVTVSVSARCA